MDKTKRKLKNVKSLVFEENEDAKQREEIGDINWLKLREMENQIKFVNMEIEQLRKQESGMHKIKV